MIKSIYDFEGKDEIFSPQLIYYPAIIRSNIRQMIEIAGGPDRLWPHIKTYKMPAVVKMLLDEGITRVKCATIAEAEMAADAGVSDITLAYPLVGPNIGRFLRLSAAYPDIRFYAIEDDDAQAKKLSDMAQAAGERVRLLADVDMGQHRTGIPLDKLADTYQRWNSLPGVVLCGMHCYDGHRHESDARERLELVRQTDEPLMKVREELREKGCDVSVIIMGGTPSFPCHIRLTKDTYVSPGTCVIQDMGYRNAYPDLKFVPGAVVLTRVISRPGRTTFTLDMGYKAVAADPPGERAEIVGMEYARTVLQNEEHWVVEVPAEHAADIPPIGTELFAIPCHICPTSALYPEVPMVEDGRVTGWEPVSARNRRITY